MARFYREKLLLLMPGSQSNAGVHRPLSLGDDKGSSAAASDRCLRANVGVFVLKAYICALNLRSCCLHPMDAGDGESTQKMRGRCKTLEHHDRACCAIGTNPTYAEAAQAVTCGVFGRHPDIISRCAIRLPALSAAWPRLLPPASHVLN